MSLAEMPIEAIVESISLSEPSWEPSFIKKYENMFDIREEIEPESPEILFKRETD